MRLAVMTPRTQIQIDNLMIQLDGTPNKSRLGANAILVSSLAVAKAAAQSSACRSTVMSVARTLMFCRFPMMNIINGGAHADNPIDFQEFMIVPVAPRPSATPCAWFRKSSTRSRSSSQPTATTRTSVTKAVLPGSRFGSGALDFIMKSIEKAGYRPGEDMHIALDCASTEFFKDGKYVLEGEGRTLEPEAMAEYLAEPRRQVPIFSIEDAWQKTIGTAGRR